MPALRPKNMSPRFNRTAELPPGVLARAKARGLRRLAGMVSDEDRDAAEAAIELSEAERAAVAASRMADFESKRPGQKMFSGVRGRVASAGAALAGIKSKVMGLLGIQSAPVASKAPVNTGTDPESVEARVAGMFKFDPRAIGRTATVEKVEQIQRFVDRVQAIDPSGKVLERVSDGTPDERTAAAKVIAGILDGLSTPQASATATPATPSKPAPSAPRGLSGVEAAIAKEIGTARSTSTTTPFRPATVPSKPSAPAPVKPAPVQGGSLSSRLTGSAKAEAAIREEMGLPPKPEHVALAAKLSNQNSK